MKKAASIFILAAVLIGCGAESQQVKTPDQAVLKTYELQQQSNTARIEKLEKELSETKESLERMQRQSKLLGDSYDGLLSLFNEQKRVMTNIVNSLSKLFADEPKKDEKK